MMFKMIGYGRIHLLNVQRSIHFNNAWLSTASKSFQKPLQGTLKKPEYLSTIITKSSSQETASNECQAPPTENHDADDPTTLPQRPSLSFEDLKINKILIDGLRASGITFPSQVQQAAIPEILSGANVAVQCYTGSGKTLAFLLPVLSMAIQRAEEEWSNVTRKTRGEAGTIQAIIVTPSRELAMQIVRVAQSLLPESAKRAVQQCIGGANMLRQREALKLYKPILVVGTPGRLAELSRDGSLQSHKCGILVLDEADQLLAPQFREEMARITDHTGKKCDAGRQTIIVSATLTPKVLSLCESWCSHPRQVFVGSLGSHSGSTTGPADNDDDGDNHDVESIKTKATTPNWGWGAPGQTYNPELHSAGIGSAGGYGNRDAAPAIAPGLTHVYVTSPPQHRVDTLRRAIHAINAQRALVFMNFQQRLKETEGKLAARKMKVASLHGEMNKQERQNTLAAFKAGKYRALLVSDVAARGLDIPDCDAVFNLELPTDAAHYAHRAGRTGRAGKKGVVVTVATGGEKFVVEKLGKRLGVDFSEVKLEGGEALYDGTYFRKNDFVDNAVDNVAWWDNNG